MRPYFVFALSLTLVLTTTTFASAAVQTETVSYSDGDTELQGHLAWDDASDEPRPAVLVVHEWWGHDAYARRRAEQLAEMGYVAFALDMYGKGKLTEHPSDAMQWSSAVRENVDAWRERATAGLKVLKDHKLVDDDRIAAIGYCFGGATVLQLAYANAGLAGVVSFHGALPAASAEEAAAIETPMLICHGAADGFVPDAQVAAFRAPLDEAGADYQLIYYAGIRHSFTNPDADRRGLPGIKYDAQADARSWKHMQDFFAEVFTQGD